MELRKAYLEMIKHFPGGWDAIAPALGMSSRDALENRIYERKGQCISVHTAIQMQKFTGTSFFAQAVAQETGGVFVTLPESANLADRDDLLEKFTKLYAVLGELSSRFKEATADGEIDHKERADLKEIGHHIHTTVAELLALTFLIYCREGQEG